MAVLRFGTKFPLFPQDSDAFPIGVQLDQRVQGRSHRLGICVVAVVEKMHAMDFFDLQTRFGKRRSDEAGGAILKGKTKDASGGNCEQCVLHHVQTRYRQLCAATVRSLQYRKVCSALALTDFAGTDRSGSRTS